MMMRFTCAILLSICAVSATPVFAQAPAGAQANPTVKDSTIGTVVSSTRTTLVVRTDPDEYRLFELNPDTTRPAKLPPGATVNVTSTGRDANGVSLATFVRVTSAPAPGTKDTTGAPAPAAASPADEPVPQEVRQLEQSIKRQTSRFRLGIRGGAALDPELIMIGAQSLIGPFFSNNIWARPNIEFGFGEVTDLIGLNMEAIYRVPVTERNSRWGFFFGGGPAFNFVKLGFTQEGVPEDEGFSFDDFDLDVGLNVVAGVQSRGGMFYELKTTVYANPGMRFLVGTSF